MLVLLAQSCPPLCNSMDCTQPGSFVHGILGQEYWSGWPLPSPGDLPDPGIEPQSPALQADSYRLSHQGSTLTYFLKHAHIRVNEESPLDLQERGKTAIYFTPEFMSLRLISDSSSETCAGRLEVFYNGAWGSVGKSDMSATTVGVVCRQLGCTDKGSIRPAPSDKVENRYMWVDNVRCPKGPETLWQCPSSPWKRRLASPSEETWITCADKIRLQEGTTNCSGRVEVWHGGSWGTVCDDSWDLNDAQVVCRQLGCGLALEAGKEAAFGQGTGPIWLNEVKCKGNESSLWDCPARSWGHSDCGHKEDASVKCSEIAESKGSVKAAGHSSTVALGILGVILLAFLIATLLWIQRRRQRQRLAVSSRGENSVHEIQYREMNSCLKADDLDLYNSSGDHVDVQ